MKLIAPCVAVVQWSVLLSRDSMARHSHGVHASAVRVLGLLAEAGCLWCCAGESNLGEVMHYCAAPAAGRGCCPSCSV